MTRSPLSLSVAATRPTWVAFSSTANAAEPESNTGAVLTAVGVAARCAAVPAPSVLTARTSKVYGVSLSSPLTV